jgi:hypothetical protein
VPYPLHDLCLKRKLQNPEEEEEVSVVDDRRENSRIHMMERENSRIQKKQVGEDDGKVKRTLKKDSKEPEIVKRETDVANMLDDPIQL